MPEPLDPAAYRDVVRRALAEDVGTGDVTTRATVPAGAVGQGTLVAKQACVVCGLDVVREVFAQVDSATRLTACCADGDRVAVGDVIGVVRGPAAALLTGERTALNVLQYLSGIATVSRTYVDAAAGRTTILDTRKTTPALRALAKYAVRCGGAVNHRVGLYDGVLIKDNHIRLGGGIRAAVARARAEAPGLTIEVETQSMADVDEALAAGADIIMLDNFDDEATQVAIARIAGRAKVELSGNMSLERVARLAALAPDFISVGALTHSAPAVDISFEIDAT